MECKEIDVRRDGEDSGGLRIKSAFLTQTQNTEKLILDAQPLKGRLISEHYCIAKAIA